MSSAEIGNFPEVVFDIDMGKKYSYVDFDYAAYEALVYSVGGDRQVYEDAKIRIGRPRWGGMLQGTYKSDTGETRCTAYDFRINNNLAHETRHYADHRNDQVSKKAVIAANVSAVGAFTTGTINILSIAAYQIPIETVQNTAENIGLSAALVSLGAVAAYGAFYHLSPHERRARATGRLNQRNPIITLSKNHPA